jgi:hypothetical protein
MLVLLILKKHTLNLIFSEYRNPESIKNINKYSCVRLGEDILERKYFFVVSCYSNYNF